MQPQIFFPTKNVPTSPLSQAVTLVALIAALCLTVACGKDSGGDSDSSDALVGTWKVSGATENPTACTAEGPASTADTEFFRLKMDSFWSGTAKTLVYNTCTSASDCSDTINLNWIFASKADGVWTGSSQMAGGSGQICTYINYVTTAKIVDGKAVLERKTWTAKDVESPSGTCESSGAAFEAAIATADCTAYEVWRADPI